ncbi:glycerate kinase [Providencia sp. wls1943]|uniref:glycerate kinase family protein n=1 Tax=Providencia sp. wls1943 TaxID=2675150 RepID=UPI0012B67D4E|nr:glycerate kinase [Providencia sp. wls1943]MTB66960.1 glycerate kinase [Providencia sp. wls1943]
MKIIIAPDSFKESMSAELATQSVIKGFQRVFPDAEYISLPVADGGEGTVDALIAAQHGEKIPVTVAGPLGLPVMAYYGLLAESKTAVIEMAQASGLMLVPIAKRNPMLTNSYGTGELIANALALGVERIILGIGGSATVDGGVGMLQALGVRFYDENHQLLKSKGNILSQIAHIDIQQLDPRLSQCKIDIACDVSNPLVGEHGSAAVFGPQKGATPEMVAELDNGLNQFAALLQQLTGTDYRYLAGGGAAGGIAVAAAALLGGELKSGIEIVMDALAFEQHLQDADLVIIGEGSMDGQTAGGKAPFGIARLAAKHQVPVIALSGVLGDGVEGLHQEGVTAVFSILPRLSSLSEALKQGAENLENTAFNVARVLNMGRHL